MILEKFCLKEPLGVDWPKQYAVLRPKINGDLSPDSLYLTTPEGESIPADFNSGSGNEIRLGMLLELKANEYREFYIQSRQPVRREACVQVIRQGEKTVVKSGTLTCAFPADGKYPAGLVPAPLIEISANGISAAGRLGCDRAAEIKTEIIARSLSAEITVRYQFSNGDFYNAIFTIYKDLPEICITEDFSCDGEMLLQLAFPDFRSQTAYARMHTPAKEKGVSDEWKRIVYPVCKKPDSVRLQPFYTWDYNTATLLQLWEGGQSVCVVPIRPSEWKNGIQNSPVVTTGTGMEISAPLTEGARKWVLSLPENAPEGEGFRLTSPYQNWDNMIKCPIDKTYYADRLCAVCGGPNLSDALNWNLSVTCEAIHPRLLIKKGEVLELRKQIREWDWLCSTIDAHKDDAEGFDPAGVYLSTGDEKYAKIVKTYITDWLRSRIWMMVRMGYSLHELVCIRLSRPIRLVALDYDLAESSPCFSDVDKQEITAGFAFLAHCIASDDYWPDKSIGFSKGNHNFHSDRFSALGTLACLLNLPQSKAWIDYVQSEIEKELSTAIYPGGAWIEAPNYQAYSMNYLILLFAVLKNSGYNDYFKDSRFVSTMDFLASIQTIRDIRSGIHMMPTIGDTAANYWSQSFQNVFAWAAKMTKEDADFSKRMMRAWLYAGKPVINAGGELNSTFKTLALIDKDLPVASPESPVSRHFNEFGAVMRSSDGYLLLKAGSTRMHYDHDEGTLIWYEKGVPILADIGSQYCPGVDATFMHNRVSIDHKTDECRGRILRFETTPDMDRAVMQVEIIRTQEWPEWPNRDPGWSFRYQPPAEDIPPHLWTRSVSYLKNPGALLVRDSINGPFPTDLNFLLFADGVKDCGDHLVFAGQFGVDIAVWTFGGSSFEIFDWGYDGLDEPLFSKAFGMDWHHYRWMWEGDMRAMDERVKLLRIYGSTNADYCTFLLPFTPGSDPGRVSMLPGQDGVEWVREGQTVRVYI